MKVRKFMFNNIKWDDEHGIYYDVERKNAIEVSGIKWYVELKHNEESCKLALRKQLKVRLGWPVLRATEIQEFWIKQLVVRPNEKMFLIVENFSGKERYEIEIIKYKDDVEGSPKYKITTFVYAVNRGSYVVRHECLNQMEIKENIKEIPYCLKVFPFLLPFGKFFDIEE